MKDFIIFLVRLYIKRLKNQNKKLTYQELKASANFEFTGVKSLDYLPSRSKSHQHSLSVTVSSVCVYTCMHVSG